MTGDDLDRGPTRTSAAISTVAALLAVALLGPGFVQAVSVPGAILVGIGCVVGSRKAVDYGVLCLVAGIALIGVGGAPPERLVPCTLLAILAWDAGGYGIGLGEQLGRAAETRRAEVVHSALTLGVGAAGASIGYGAFRSTAGGRPVLALALLLAGAVTIAIAVR